jgi:hypothetical protein
LGADSFPCIEKRPEIFSPPALNAAGFFLIRVDRDIVGFMFDRTSRTKAKQPMALDNMLA